MGAKTDYSYNVPHHAADEQGLGKIVEGARGGYIDFTDGTGLEVKEVDVTAALLDAASGAPAKRASGVLTLGGANPTSVLAATTGLATVTSVQLTLLSATSPGLDPADLTVDFANLLGNNVLAGQFNVYAWKYTSSSNPTLIASTNSTAQIAWVACGT